MQRKLFLLVFRMKNKKKKYENLHQNLIEQCKKGNSQAQFEIYRLYYKAMFNTSLRIVNDTAEAEDTMQEAFLAAFEKLHTYAGEVSFGAWLKRIVINRSLDVLKKRQVSFEPLGKQVATQASEPANHTSKETQARVEQVKQAIGKLPDGYRVVLSLYLLEGYDHDEIAQILNITPSASRSQLTRAKRKLVDLLKTN